MMGNFLTTLGNAPEEDRAMFEELGLNISRQPDNGSNPRPDNRSGWLDGETPGVIEEFLTGDGNRTAAAPEASQPTDGGAAGERTVELGVRLWDPSTQLRFHKTRPRAHPGA